MEEIFALVIPPLLTLIVLIVPIIIIVSQFKQYNKVQKQREAQRIEENRKRETERKLRESQESIKKATEEKRKKEEEKRQVESWTVRYTQSPYVQKYARAFANEFTNRIRSYNYDIHSREIDVNTWRSASYANELTYLKVDGIDFYKENVKEFDNEFQLQGFLNAAAIVAEEIVKREYVASHPVGMKGEKYKIEISSRYSPPRFYGSYDYYHNYTVELHYLATNPCYEPPKDLI